jgi:hypothetical protein
VIAKWEGRDATDVFRALHDPSTFKKLNQFKYKVQDSSTVVQPSSRSLRFEALRLKLQVTDYFSVIFFGLFIFDQLVKTKKITENGIIQDKSIVEYLQDYYNCFFFRDRDVFGCF